MKFLANDNGSVVALKSKFIYEARGSADKFCIVDEEKEADGTKTVTLKAYSGELRGLKKECFNVEPQNPSIGDFMKEKVNPANFRESIKEPVSNLLSVLKNNPDKILGNSASDIERRNTFLIPFVKKFQNLVSSPHIKFSDAISILKDKLGTSFNADYEQGAINYIISQLRQQS